MIDERWLDLMNRDDAQLTPAEIAEGWHFCDEWDYLLVGPGSCEKCSHLVGRSGPPKWLYSLGTCLLVVVLYFLLIVVVPVAMGWVKVGR